MPSSRFDARVFRPATSGGAGPRPARLDLITGRVIEVQQASDEEQVRFGEAVHDIAEVPGAACIGRPTTLTAR